MNDRRHRRKCTVANGFNGFGKDKGTSNSAGRKGNSPGERNVPDNRGVLHVDVRGACAAW